MNTPGNLIGPAESVFFMAKDLNKLNEVKRNGPGEDHTLVLTDDTEIGVALFKGNINLSEDDYCDGNYSDDIERVFDEWSFRSYMENHPEVNIVNVVFFDFLS